MTPRLLLACFEPFAGRRGNLSERAVERLRLRHGAGWFRARGVRVVRLPVAWGRVGSRLETALDRWRPDAVLLTGEHRRSRKVQIERVALNVAHATLADNDGRRRHLASVVDSAPLALATTADVEQLQAGIRRRGVPVALSHHAGTFICNAALYVALSRCPGAVFLHLPGRFASPGKGTHLDRLADALEAAIDHLRGEGRP